MKLEFNSFGFWIAFIIFIVAIVLCVNTWNPIVAMLGALALSRMLP